MTVRRPLTQDGTSGLIEMTTAQMTAMTNLAVYLFQQSSPVGLAVVSSGGSLGTIADNRSGASAVATSSGAGTPGNSGDDHPTAGALTNTATNFDKINATNTTPSQPTGNVYPVYWDNITGNITEMTLVDFLDTFWLPARAILIESTVAANQANTFFVSSSASVTDSTNLGTVFIDTVTNPSAFSGISATTDRANVTNATFSLFKRTTGIADPLPTVFPIRVDGTSGVAMPTSAQFRTLLGDELRYAVSATTGYKIEYNINGSGNSRGAMTDSTITGTTQVTDTTGSSPSQTYRSQNFPSGTSSVANTYTLKINGT